jgi:hypothetical protein
MSEVLMMVRYQIIVRPSKRLIGMNAEGSMPRDECITVHVE